MPVGHGGTGTAKVLKEAERRGAGGDGGGVDGDYS